MGAFSDWIFRNIDSIRSYDSSYSVLGIGKNALRMIENAHKIALEKTVFLKDSINQRKNS